MIGLNPGDGILMKGFKSHVGDGYSNMTFGAPKGKLAYHLFMWLGVYEDAHPSRNSTADDRLNALGWVFDPAAAKKALAERRAKAGAA